MSLPDFTCPGLHDLALSLATDRRLPQGVILIEAFAALEHLAVHLRGGNEAEAALVAAPQKTAA